MTVTDLPTLIRRRIRTEPTATPESHDVTLLREMLDNPDLAGYHDQIRESLVKLTATTVLAA